ncbi:urea transporter [Streptomyces sp. NPDC060028]|uniref:urea transporter n=1 Tax=Streptomyces sp. NPDC060028 TaxID=3347041 RepID=UPI0036C0238F
MRFCGPLPEGVYVAAAPGVAKAPEKGSGSSGSGTGERHPVKFVLEVPRSVAQVDFMPSALCGVFLVSALFASGWQYGRLSAHRRRFESGRRGHFCGRGFPGYLPGQRRRNLLHAQWYVGLLFLAGIFVADRLAGAMACVGSATGLLVAWMPGAPAQGVAQGLMGYNAVLVAMALCGVFIAPGTAALAYAVAGAGVATALPSSSAPWTSPAARSWRSARAPPVWPLRSWRATARTSSGRASARTTCRSSSSVCP